MRKVKGYADFGPIRIAPLPQGIVITDRDDGTLWLLSHTQDPVGPDGEGYVSINDYIHPAIHYNVYEAYEEPIVDIIPIRQAIRLLVRGGYFGYEIVNFGHATSDINHGPIQTRKEVNRRTARIYIPLSFNTNENVLAWEPETLV